MAKGALKGFEKVADLVEIAGALQPLTAVMAGGERVEDLLLVESARDHGIIKRIVLVGRKQLISDAIARIGIHVPREDILAADNDNDAASITAELVKTGAVHMVLKGSTPTHVLHHHMLPLAIRNTVSLVSIFDAAPIANGRPMILTDAGVTTVCNYARIAGLIQNSIDVARTVMQIEKPRVALLSANEKILPTLPSTQLGAAFAQRGWPDAYVYGPLSLDLATDPKAVASKGLPNMHDAYEVAGKADILVCPNIDTGNVIYKMISALIKYGLASLANIIMGFPKPYVLLSRSDALETRLNSVALGAIYAQSGLGDQPAPAHLAVCVNTRTYHIIAVIASSSSIAFSLFENDICVQHVESEYAPSAVGTPEELQHQANELVQNILDTLQTNKWEKVDAIAAHDGFLRPHTEAKPEGICVLAEFLEGKMAVNESLVSAMRNYPERQDVNNLIVPVVTALAKALKTSAYAVQPAMINGLVDSDATPGSRILSGNSTSHLLSIHAAACKTAKAIGRPLEEIDLIAAHLGGGVTLAVVHGGRMSPADIVSLPGDDFPSTQIEQMSPQELVEDKINAGDKDGRRGIDAMISRIAREIGGLYVAAGCEVEAIVFTGNMMRNECIRNGLKKRLVRLAPIVIFEQPLEMEALAAEALRVITAGNRTNR